MHFGQPVQRVHDASSRFCRSPPDHLRLRKKLTNPAVELSFILSSRVKAYRNSICKIITAPDTAILNNSDDSNAGELPLTEVARFKTRCLEVFLLNRLTARGPAFFLGPASHFVPFGVIPFFEGGMLSLFPSCCLEKNFSIRPAKLVTLPARSRPVEGRKNN